MSTSKNRRNKERRHRRMQESRDKVHNIRKTLETETDEEKINELHRDLDYWSQYTSRRANQL